jgi:hypothetical protein
MATLNEALPVYLGLGVSNHPSQSAERLVAAFGHSEATRLAAECPRITGAIGTRGPMGAHSFEGRVIRENLQTRTGVALRSLVPDGSFWAVS